jgi:hypothetical protein
MQTSNANQSIRSSSSVWYLLAEYALSEITFDYAKEVELMIGFLFQTFRELGAPLEWIGTIEMKLTGLAKKAQASIKEAARTGCTTQNEVASRSSFAMTKQGRLERFGSIRIFCQKKLIDDINSANNSTRGDKEQTVEHDPFIYSSSTIMKGGWGYFIIERSGDDAGSAERSYPMIDLYLYKEGE